MKKILLALALLACPAFAINLSIAVVDMNKVIQSSPQMIKIQADLDKTFSPRHDAIVVKVNKVKSDNENLLKNGNVMKKEDRDALIKKINESRNAVMMAQQKFQKDYETARSRKLKELFDKIKNVTSVIAKEKHFDLILNSGTTPFAKQNLDVTNELIERLKKQG